MTQLLLGLALFFGMHSTSIYALGLRDSLAAKNELAWKGFYVVVSVIGFLLMLRGYGELRQAPVILYEPPAFLRHISMLVMLPAFVCLIAPYFPGRIKTVLKHPQLVAVKLWSVAHLLVNGTLGDVLLFGSFLAWAVADRISMKNRQQRALPGLPESGVNDVIIVVAGLAMYFVFAIWLHVRLIGVPLFG